MALGHKRFAPIWVPLGGAHAPIVCSVSAESLKDEAVELRPWSFKDVDAIVECIDGDPEIARWLDQVPQPYTRQDARGYVGGIGEQAFAITDAGTGRLLGSIGVRWNERRDVGEIGYWVRADARGRGVITRALRLVSRFAFEHEGAARLQLRADVDNVGSRRAAEKAGYSFEGVQRAAHWNERLGRRQDHAMYSLLPGDVE